MTRNEHGLAHSATLDQPGPSLIVGTCLGQYRASLRDQRLRLSDILDAVPVVAFVELCFGSVDLRLRCVELIRERLGIEPRQHISLFDLCSLLHRHEGNPSWDPESQVYRANVDVAI